MVRVSMWEEPSGRWRAQAETDPSLRASAETRDRCLARIRRLAIERTDARAGPLVLTVEVLPRLVGVAEAAQILGWDKRRLITYVDRGRFPEPVERLASGRIWRRADVEAYAARWRARATGRGARA